MRKQIGLVAVSLMALLACGRPPQAHADTIGSMSCMDVLQVLDDTSDRKAEMDQIYHWMHVRLKVDDDSAMVMLGHASLTRKWDEKSFIILEVVIASSCSSDRDATLAEHTDNTFSSLNEKELDIINANK